ncbi:hypothetical protein BJ970_007328 [Saccharopolyspora phatthalungensis]|uniref:Uncharacterized protein n=1 Tax=Saccharopolyspora phatthalungensis TaxID=664693 RepID=A0A840QK49_9PSEU|nr:hypothetical protein [Saccharopolyspora phatthalungensis]
MNVTPRVGTEVEHLPSPHVIARAETCTLADPEAYESAGLINRPRERCCERAGARSGGTGN